MHEIFRAWRELVRQSKTGTQAPRADVKANIKLKRLSRQDTVVWEYNIIGCWPTEFTPGDLNDESAPLQPEATLQYDLYTEGADSEGSSININIPLPF